MQKYILLICVFSVISLSISAQWIWQNPKPTGEFLYNIEFPSENIGYGTGAVGTIIKTIDGGESWFSLGSIAMDYIMETSFINNEFGYAIGYYKKLYYTEDGGYEWDEIETGIVSGNFVTGEFINVDTGFIACEGGHIFKTVDAGISWNCINNTNTSTVNDLYFVNSETGYGCCQNGNVLKTDDGGYTWTSTPVEFDYDLVSICFTDELTGYVCGSHNFHKTTDGGHSWTTILPTGNIDEEIYFYSKCFFINENQGYVGTDMGNVFSTSDGGLTWTNHIFGNEFMTFAMYAKLNGEVYIGTQLGEIFKSTDFASSWSIITESLTEEYCQIYSADFWGINNGIAVGNKGKIFKTSNGGFLWELITINQAYDVTDIKYLSENKVIATTGLGTVIISEDGGNTWDFIHITNNYFIMSLFFTDELNGWVAGSGGKIYKTNDGGTTWTNQAFANDAYFYDISFIDDTTGYAVGSYDRIFKTTDAGQSWNLKMEDLESESAWESVAFMNRDTGFVCGYFGKIAKTQDGGETWSFLDMGLPDVIFYDAMFNEGDTGYIAGSFGLLLRTIDKGDTWESLSKFTNNGLLKILQNDAGHFYVFGQNAAILINKMTPKNAFYVNDAIKNSTGIYPNPATNTIQFTVEDNFVKEYKIYDIYGKIQISGFTLNSIDISNLKNGTYIIEIQINESAIRSKFVKTE